MMENRKFSCGISGPDEVYEISLIREEDKIGRRRDDVVKMLVENFLQDETLVRSLRVGANLTDESDMNDYKADERLIIETVVDAGSVILAEHKKSGRIAGALVLLIHERSKTNEEKSNGCENRLKSPVMKDFFGYMEKIDREENIFEIYPSCEVWAEVNIIAINKLDRNKGLAFELYKAGFELAKNIPKVTIFAAKCTSMYSEKIALKIGQKTIAKFDVTKLKDPREGKPVFQDTVPHNMVTLMVSEL